MRGNRRAILVDLHEKNLDPKKKHFSVDKLGRLKNQPIDELTKKQSVSKIESKEKVDVELEKENTKIVLESKETESTISLEETTFSEEITLQQEIELVQQEQQDIVETKIEKSQKKKKKSN